MVKNTGTTSKHITNWFKEAVNVDLCELFAGLRVLFLFPFSFIQVKWYIDESVMEGGPLKCWPHCPSIENGPFGGSTYSHRYYLIELHFHWGCQGHDDCTGTKEDGTLGSEHTVDGMA